jgi:hypothetical protein
MLKQDQVRQELAAPHVGGERRRWQEGVLLVILLAAWMLGAGCGGTQNALAEMAGTYLQELPASNGMHRIYTLELRPDFSCAMTRDYVNRGKVTEIGTWTNNGRTVILTLKGKKTSQPATVVEFKWRKKDITSTKWDENLFGTEGLGTFHRR